MNIENYTVISQTSIMLNISITSINLWSVKTFLLVIIIVLRLFIIFKPLLLLIIFEETTPKNVLRKKDNFELRN